jgi:hypothetical protein
MWQAANLKDFSADMLLPGITINTSRWSAPSGNPRLQDKVQSLSLQRSAQALARVLRLRHLTYEPPPTILKSSEVTASTGSKPSMALRTFLAR